MEALNNIDGFSSTDAMKLGSLLSSSVGFGPLSVSYKLDMSVPQVIIDASLFGVSIGHAVINTQSPTATIGGSIGIAEASVQLTANFANKSLHYDVVVKNPWSTLVDKCGTLITW